MQAVGNKESRLCGRDIENSRSGAGGKKKDKTLFTWNETASGNRPCLSWRTGLISS